MAKLFTSHDYFHLHSIFGFICLLNFMLRLYNIILYKVAFTINANKTIDILAILSHLILPLLSLQFRLPKNRNYTSPMIWTEFRYHSLLFASRHVIMTLFHLVNIKINLYLEILFKTGLIIVVLHLSNVITEKYGSTYSRTTNAMPYPEHLNKDEINKIKLEYAKRQFGATLFSVIPDPTYTFLPLYALQLSPFLMTLVRKGKCNSKYYHIIYSIALLFPFYFHYFIKISFFKFSLNDILFGIIYTLSFTLRINYNLNKFLLWLCIIPFFILIWISTGNIFINYGILIHTYILFYQLYYDCKIFSVLFS
jgi:hypothetical protein